MQTHAVLQLGNKFDGIIIKSCQINSVCLHPQSCFKYARCRFHIRAHQGEDQHVWCIWTSTVELRKEASAAHSKITCLSSPTAPLPQDKHTLWALSTRVLVCAQRHASRAAAPRVATGCKGPRKTKHRFPQQAKCVLVTVVMINTPLGNRHTVYPETIQRGVFTSFGRPTRLIIDHKGPGQHAQKPYAFHHQ